MKIPLSTHPETINQLLVRSLKLYWYSFTKVFLLSLLISILVFIPEIITYATNNDYFANLSFFNLQRLWLLLINLGALTLFVALLWRIRCVVTDTHEAVKDDLKVALKKMPYIIVATLLTTILCMVINLLCVTFIYLTIGHFNDAHTVIINWKDIWVSGILIAIQTILLGYLAIAWCFYLPLIVIENLGILLSLKKSIRLVWKNWWRTFLAQVTPWILYIVALVILKNIINLNISLFYEQAKQTPTLSILCLHILVFALFLPWSASLLMVQLRDLELRKAEAERKS